MERGQAANCLLNLEPPPHTKTATKHMATIVIPLLMPGLSPRQLTSKGARNRTPDTGLAGQSLTSSRCGRVGTALCRSYTVRYWWLEELSSDVDDERLWLSNGNHLDSGSNAKVNPVHHLLPLGVGSCRRFVRVRACSTRRGRRRNADWGRSVEHRSDNAPQVVSLGRSL